MTQAWKGVAYACANISAVAQTPTLPNMQKRFDVARHSKTKSCCSARRCTAPHDNPLSLHSTQRNELHPCISPATRQRPPTLMHAHTRTRACFSKQRQQAQLHILTYAGQELRTSPTRQRTDHLFLPRKRMHGDKQRTPCHTTARMHRSQQHVQKQPLNAHPFVSLAFPKQPQQNEQHSALKLRAPAEDANDTRKTRRNRGQSTEKTEFRPKESKYCRYVLHTFPFAHHPSNLTIPRQAN